MRSVHFPDVLWVAVALVAVAAACSMSLFGEWGSFVILGAFMTLALVMAVSGAVRGREIVLWLALVVAAFNFTPALFSPTSLVGASPVWERLVKDVPLLLCLATGALLPSRKNTGDLPQRIAVLAAIILVELLAVFHSASGVWVSLRYYLAYPALALAAARFDLRGDERRRLFLLIASLGAVEGALAAAEFVGLFGHTYFAGYVTLGSHARAIGTLGNPDNLALFLGLPALVLFAMLDTGEMMKRPAAAILLIVVLAGIAASFSKAAPIALAFAMLVQTRRLRGRPRILLSLVLMAGFLAAAVGARGAGSTLGTRPQSTVMGYQQWTATVGTFFVGQGIGTQAQLNGDELQANITDDMLLTIALEGGLILLLGCGWVLLGAVRLARRATGMEAAFFGYAIFFLLYTPVYENLRLYPAAFLFWLGIGLACRRRPPATSDTANRHVAHRGRLTDPAPTPPVAGAYVG